MGKSTETTNPLVNICQLVISAQHNPECSEGLFWGTPWQKCFKKGFGGEGSFAASAAGGEGVGEGINAPKQVTGLNGIFCRT